MTRMAPPRKVYHSDRRVNFGGGVYSDTRAGTRSAKSGGYGWIDKNGHFIQESREDLHKPAVAKSLIWVNAHGAPYNPPWVKAGRKIEDYTWERQHNATLQNAVGTFRTCKRYGVKVEWEPKDLNPLAADSILRRMFEQLAKAAKQVFGSKWRSKVTVKCLTNLGGGIKYCFRVLKAAYEAGFRTMVLARGEWAHKVINEPFITWNRGGRVA